MTTRKKLPRGIRNNNPLNIRIGNTWVGEVTSPTDHEFEQFVEMKYGVRAAFIILRNYIKRHKQDTISKIIARWAPANENNTAKYIKTVSERSMIPTKERLSFENMPQMVKLFQAMCYVENGREIDEEAIIAGYELAR